MRSIVITGGPGSGKSTLLNALQEQGFRVMQEVSRGLIREQVALESTCLPWLDLNAFAALCLEKMVADFKSADANAATFFDRGIPDIVAYLKVGGLEIGPALSAAVRECRYASTVLIAPPWEAIYVNDEERWQTFEDSAALYEAVFQVYQEAGYELIILPFGTVEERVEFVLKTLNQ
ncbi:AAA family ATPase [Dyadobacter crusticola]|uniref:AAA family ATPase n=1 Tax=Dyadobacter crusticola TaxID=292407 RepID=UPI00068D623D|nr:AAA family ATPase [Dyadobacter crusticola]